jgi:hypothetical protein
MAKVFGAMIAESMLANKAKIVADLEAKTNELRAQVDAPEDPEAEELASLVAKLQGGICEPGRSALLRIVEILAKKKLPVAGRGHTLSLEQGMVIVFLKTVGTGEYPSGEPCLMINGSSALRMAGSVDGSVPARPSVIRPADPREIATFVEEAIAHFPETLAKYLL